MSSLFASDKELVPCRNEGAGETKQAERQEGVRSEEDGPAGGRRRATAVQVSRKREIDCRLGAGHGEERTSNMPSMSMTLEVSKLSGWLNAD
eukprot:scaffold50223_cov65-Phaeocystis_antarctica.AAC.1